MEHIKLIVDAQFSEIPEIFKYQEAIFRAITGQNPPVGYQANKNEVMTINVPTDKIQVFCGK